MKSIEFRAEMRMLYEPGAIAKHLKWRVVSIRQEGFLPRTLPKMVALVDTKANACLVAIALQANPIL